MLIVISKIHNALVLYISLSAYKRVSSFATLTVARWK